MKKHFSTFAWPAIALGLLCACEDVPAPYFILEEEPNDPAKTGIYQNETFATTFGDFDVYTEKTDGFSWAIKYSAATISGYDNSAKENKASKSWLISSPMDLTASTGAYVTFDYILRYKRSSTKEQVLVSTDYVDDPTTATWTDLSIALTEGTDYTTFYTATCNLPEAVIGQSAVTLAFFYECGGNEASTWEVKNLLVKEGDGGDTPDTPNPPTPPVGDNTRENPYTVAQATATTGSKAWVKGYIVGYIADKSIDSAVFGMTDGNGFKTNVLISDNADETATANCLPVQLPAGALRENLQVTSETYKKEVTIYGSLEKYFGVNGMKTPTFAIIDGRNIGTDPDNEPSEGDYIFNNSLLGDEAGFTTNNVTMPSELSYIWKNDAVYGWKASAYFNNTRYTTESWLISPAITLPAEDCHLTFDHALNFGTTEYVSVLISTDKNNWSKLSVPTWPTGNDWNWVSSGKIDLSAYKGQTVYVGFKYTSSQSDNVAATWEIKNFAVVKGAGSAGGETPGGDDTPGGNPSETTGNGTFASPYTTADVLSLYAANTAINQKAYVKAYIVGYIDGASFASGATFAIPGENQTEVLVADSPTETTATKCVPVQLPKGAIRDGIDLFLNPSYYQKEVLLYGAITKYFTVAGLKEVSYAEVESTAIGTKPE